MATWYDTYWANFKSVIEGTWTEIPAGQYFVDTSLERRDWINLLNDKQLKGAWCAIKLDITPDDMLPDWPCYSVAANVHYITPTDYAPDPDVNVKTITEFLTHKLIVLAQAFRQAQTVGSVMADMPIVINADDPINRELLDAKLFYQAGSVTITSIVTDAGDS